MPVRCVPVPSVLPVFNPVTQSVDQDHLSVPSDLLSDTKKKKKTDTNSTSEDYLIIGFDTEYQCRGAEPDAAFKNEILSYQYHCVLSNGTKRTEWNGIYCPPPNERISLGQFLLLALSDGFKHGLLPDPLPKSISLVGHFNRADFPAFSDFHAFQKSLSALRGTFVTLGNRLLDVPLRFHGDVEKPLKVRVRDTMLLAPEKARSLEALGDLVGVPKEKLHDDPNEARSIIAHMKALRDDNWELFKTYALTDARICALYAEKFVHLVKEELGQFRLPSTLSSVGEKLMLKQWKDAGKDRLRLLGKEIIEKTTWNERRQRYVTRKEVVYRGSLHDEEQFATECYHGGWNEQHWFGPSYSASWSDWDIASAYPTAMALVMAPDWDNPRYTCDVEEFTPLAFGFARISFRFPTNVRYPTIPVRTEHGLIFPLSGESYVCAPEIALARRLGAKIEIKRGLIFPTSDAEYVFRDFIKEGLRRRSVASAGLEEATWKEVVNSTYGKTAQGLKPKRVYDNRSEDTRQVPESKITNPFYAAFITSFVRALVGEIMNDLPEYTMVFSCTTDGFITDATDAAVRNACRGSLTQVALQARRELTGDDAARVLEKKHAARMLLGWTTRGQATLVPWVEQELVVVVDPESPTKYLEIRPVQPGGPEFAHILAKGGIKVPNHLDTKEEKNRYMVKLFKDRTPHTTIDVDHFISLKEMLEEETDLIMETHTRRLGMEYDFKRRPVAWGSHTNGHLVFSTRPWGSIDEYRRFRAAFDAYQKADRNCLKTVEELEAMLPYALSKVSPRPGKRRGYVTKKDADLNILKRLICSAFAHGIGGLTYKSARVLAEHMSESGIPTTHKDVENARTNVKEGPFEPQPCPVTQRSKDAVASLKTLYPAFNEALVFGQSIPEITEDTNVSVWDRLFVQRAGIQNPFEDYLTNFAVWDALAESEGPCLSLTLPGVPSRIAIEDFSIHPNPDFLPSCYGPHGHRVQSDPQYLGRAD